MGKKALIMYACGDHIAAALYQGSDKIAQETYTDISVAAEKITAMAAGAELVLCPGGCVKPVSAGIYTLNAKACEDAAGAENPGLQNVVMGTAFKVAEVLGVPAFFTEAMSADELLSLNRIRSHAEVAKYARGFRAEHLASIRKAVGTGRTDRGNFIAAYVDDMVSVGAYENGRCIDINDCIGAEGPMGFTSSGDVPCAQMANYFLKNDVDFAQMRKTLWEESGLVGYLGTKDPAEIDKLCAENEKARGIVDAMIYQIAKWIGSSAMVLGGKVDRIIFSGKGVACKYMVSAMEKKFGRIAPISFVEDPDIEGWLAAQAMLIGCCTTPVKEY